MMLGEQPNICLSSPCNLVNNLSSPNLAVSGLEKSTAVYQTPLPI